MTSMRAGKPSLTGGYLLDNLQLGAPAKQTACRDRRHQTTGLPPVDTPVKA